MELETEKVDYNIQMDWFMRDSLRKMLDMATGKIFIIQNIKHK